jgi:5'-phosphate synthase pdxT subunit
VIIGVLALQGDFALHEKALVRIGAKSVEVRKPSELESIQGLIIPGGESTTLLKLIDEWGFRPALTAFHQAKKPIFGTCAGLILLAREVERPKQPSFGFIDITTERGPTGEEPSRYPATGEAALNGERQPLKMVFIRAPRITRMGPTVKPLAFHQGECVMAREGTVLVASFHPELTGDETVHGYFTRMVEESAG